MNKLTAISAFVSIAETKSFQETSEKLGVSRSAVTKAIQNLEDELGVRLFHRSARAVNVTSQGQVFFERCAKILKDLSETENRLMSETREPRGLVRAAIPHALARVVIPAMPDFFERYPDIEVDLRMLDTDVDLLRGGYDVWITGRSESIQLMGLKRRHIGRVPYGIVASPGYLKKHGTPKVPQDLSKHDCIGILGWDNRWRFRGPDGGSITIAINGKLTISNGPSLIEAARAGLGIARASISLFTHDIDRGRFVPLLEDYVTGSRSLTILYPNDPYPSMKTKVFIEFLAKVLRERPESQ